MEKIRSWFGRSHSTPTSETVTSEKEKVIQRIDANTNVNDLKKLIDHQEVGNVPDPKVVEFFKLFPEPYKTKAIDRFSSREGLFQWDFFRDMAMKREFESAKRGVFIEDKRELAKRLSESEIQTEQIVQETEDIREYSALEKAIRSKIPVHPDESLGLKLFQTANMMALGFCFLWAGVSSKKRKPTLTKGHYYLTIAGASYCCIYCQVAAVYRVMDWGLFDRSEDNRDALTKIADEFKQFVSSAATKAFQGKDES